MAPNPDGRVLRELVLAGPAAARAELRRETVDVATFGTTVRKLPLEEAVGEVERSGLRVVAVYGNRVVNDLIADNAAKGEAGFFADVLDLELSLCDREPFNRVGFAWQLVAERPR
jgi:S-adenosylmethionine-dependent methyltransferase